MNQAPRIDSDSMTRRVAASVIGRGQTAYKRVRHDPRQVERFECVTPSAPNVLIIGPAEMRIPAVGWGAVETVIAEQIPALIERGFGVTLLNSRRRRKWLEAFEDADIVMCHYDAFAERAIAEARRRRVPCVVATHYGYAAFPEKWSPDYQRIVGLMLAADAVACLSPAIVSTFAEFGFGVRARLTPNGSDFKPRVGPHNQGAVVLGKVEPRKGQYTLAAAATARGIPLTLIGPMHDRRLRYLSRGNRQGPVRWMGPWSRAELAAKLGNFSSLLLPSLGEADALVLYEAQLAGLPVVVSCAGRGAQQDRLPWVRVINDYALDVPDRYLDAAMHQEDHKEISDFASANYPWKNRIQPWVELISAMV